MTPELFYHEGQPPGGGGRVASNWSCTQPSLYRNRRPSIRERRGGENRTARIADANRSHVDQLGMTPWPISSNCSTGDARGHHEE